MLMTPTLEKLKQLRFEGMFHALKEQQESQQAQALSFEERLGLLVDREIVERENRQLQTRLRQATLRQKACIQDIDYSLPRHLDTTLMQALYSCRWIKEHLNVIFTGPTGVGKSFIACALGHQACVQGFRVRYSRLSVLLQQMVLAQGDGTYFKKMQQLAKTDLIILDDWGLTVLSAQERQILLELFEDRHQRASTIITAQVPQSEWHTIIGDPTLADAILDRIVHNAYHIPLKGESIRKKMSPLNNQTD